MRPFTVLDVGALPLAGEPVEASLIVAGTPETATLALGTVGGAEVGVWEMTAGGMRDIEVDEIFVVVGGAATVALLSGPRAGETIALRPGVVCRLEAGMSTEWTVPSVLRKVYIAGESSEPV